MKTSGRLTLADFKLQKIEAKLEIDKLLGGAAATCHETCQKDSQYDFIDWVDHDGEKIERLDISEERYKELLDPNYCFEKDPTVISLL